MRNLSLDLWVAEKLSVELREWIPTQGFSTYLSTLIEQAKSFLSKLKALKYRLSQEIQAQRSQRVSLASAFEVMKQRAVSEYMAEEHQALSQGLQIEAQISQM